MRSKSLFTLGSALLVAAAVAVAYLNTDERTATATGAAPPPTITSERADSTPSPRFQNPHRAPPPAPSESTASLAEWADSLPAEALAKMLTEAPPEKRQALLASWTRRDLRSLAEWFGRQSINDELHQCACAMLAEALGCRDGAAHFAWIEQSLPESARRELYAPFFRAWTKANPSAAGAKLRQLADGSSNGWDNLIGQAAAAWAERDTPRAMIWLGSLPDSATKSFAQLQATYRWVEVDAPSAAAYADEHHDPALLKAVATKWTELDPLAAATWASGTLPPSGPPRIPTPSRAGSRDSRRVPRASKSPDNSSPPGPVRIPPAPHAGCKHYPRRVLAIWPCAPFAMQLRAARRPCLCNGRRGSRTPHCGSSATQRHRSERRSSGHQFWESRINRAAPPQLSGIVFGCKNRHGLDRAALLYGHLTQFALRIFARQRA